MVIDKEKIDQWESQVRQGALQKVRADISQIAVTKISRKHAARVANLAYRVHLPNYALRLLQPFIYQEEVIAPTATIEELAEYSMSLSQIGAHQEALSIISGGSLEKSPKVLLYRAFIAIAQWQHLLAIEPLEQLLELPGIDPYQELLAQINLVACHTSLGHWTAAEKLLQIVIYTAKQQQHHLLLANAYELKAQAKLAEEDIASAEHFLDESLQVLKGKGGPFELFCLRLKAVAGLMKSKSSANFEKLQSISELSRKMNVWENHRECERNLASFRGSEKELTHVYGGTPYAEYRARLLKDSPIHLNLSDTFDWHLGAEGEPSVIDIGETEMSQFGIKGGSQLHHLLLVLSSDVYQPFRLGTLFTHLFKNERFDPVHSKDRVYQIIRRLRSWVKTHHLPLVLESTENGYRLNTQSRVIIRRPMNIQLVSPHDHRMANLASFFSDKNFTLQEAKKFLGLSQTATFHLIQSEVGKKLVRQGRGRKTQYKFAA